MPMRLGPRKWLMLTTAGIVAVVNNIVSGVIADAAAHEPGPRLARRHALDRGDRGAAALVMHRIHHRSALDAYTAGEIDWGCDRRARARPAERR